jgi:hypothetical protein
MTFHCFSASITYLLLLSAHPRLWLCFVLQFLMQDTVYQALMLIRLE